MKDEESLAVGIVLRRRRSNHPWQDVSWHLVGAVPGAPATGEWRVLRRSEAETDFLAPPLPLTLHRSETGGYLQNLAQQKPVIYVVLRRDDGEADHPLRPFHLTVCPAEAQDYLDGDDLVETTPLPPAVTAWLRDYVARFHVERPFVKRKRRDAKVEHDG